MESSSANLLQRLREASGSKSESAFSQFLGIHTQSVYDAKKREKIPDSWVRIVSEKTGVSADWLFFGRGPMRAGEEAPQAPIARAATVEELNPELVMIKKVAARLSAGNGSFETDGDIIGYYAFRSDWILRKGNPSNMALVDVIGDSMEPEIRQGDTVLIDESKKEVYGKGYYAVGVDNYALIKDVRIRPGKIILHSLNPDYEDIIIDTTEDQSDPVRIIGRVLWIARDLS